jgi:hypothetical protein
MEINELVRVAIVAEQVASHADVEVEEPPPDRIEQWVKRADRLTHARAQYWEKGQDEAVALLDEFIERAHHRADAASLVAARRYLEKFRDRDAAAGH